MENASKALIIAGAILLSILLITLGIIIFSQAQDTINSVNMNEQEIMAFNNKFTPYQGENIRGSQVNALAQAVVSSNQSANDNGEDTKVIDMKITPKTGEAQSSVTATGFARVPSGSLYDVTITYQNSLVHTITVVPAGTKKEPSK